LSKTIKDKSIPIPPTGSEAIDIKLTEDAAKPVNKGGRPKGSGHPLSPEAVEKRIESHKKYSKDAYKNHPAAKTVKIIVTNMVNRLVLQTCEKLTPDDAEELGAALAYTLDYYLPAGGLDPNSPLIVCGFAALGFGLKVVELKGKPAKAEKPADAFTAPVDSEKVVIP
jgi:hypothetical protein